MKSKIRHIALCTFLMSFIVSCTSSKKLSAEEMLHELNVDPDSISSLSTCRQIELYSEVGRHFVDRDHKVVLMPDWMDAEIDRRPSEEVAECISSEGFQLLDQLSQNSDTDAKSSLAIHALVYKAYNSNLLVYPDVEDFLDKAVCDFDVRYAYQLVMIYYITEFKKVPDYIYDSDAEEKMVSELCS